VLFTVESESSGVLTCFSNQFFDVFVRLANV